MVSVNWLLNDEPLSVKDALALELADDLLVGTSAATLRKALTDSGLGESVIGGGLSSELLQNTYSIGLKVCACAYARVFPRPCLRCVLCVFFSPRFVHGRPRYLLPVGLKEPAGLKIKMGLWRSPGVRETGRGCCALAVIRCDFRRLSKVARDRSCLWDEVAMCMFPSKSGKRVVGLARGSKLAASRMKAGIDLGKEKM